MTVQIIIGDARERLRELPDASVHCCVTSPPYFGLRDYGVDGQMGLEATPAEFVEGMVALFREVRRVLRDDGVLFLNLGDSYFGSGKGGNPDDSPHKKQRTNAGSLSVAGRVQSYDSDGTGVSGSRDRGSFSQNPDGERTGLQSSRTGDIDAGRALALAVEPLTQIRACMAELRDHLPNEDCVHPLLSAQFSASILGLAQTAIRAVEQLRASLASSYLESDLPLPAGFRLSDTLSACLSSLHSFADGVRQCAGMSGGGQGMRPHMAGSASPCEELERRIQCTDGWCSILSALGEYKPKRSILKPKDLIGIPWRVAFALQADGWWLRQDLIWSKPNPMPESVRDRCTKAHEYLFLLSKGPRYHYDAGAIAEPLESSSIARLAQNVDAQEGSDRVPGKTNGKMKAVYKTPYTGKATKEYEGTGAQDPSATKARIVEKILSGELVTRNKRSVWEVATQPFSGAHFATFPPALIEPCILAGCPKGGTVLDPFGGAGTTGLVADRLGRDAILIELNPEYADLARARLRSELCRVQSEAPEPKHDAGPLFGTAA